jgi:hypothetical protein
MLFILYAVQDVIETQSGINDRSCVCVGFSKSRHRILVFPLVQ